MEESILKSTKKILGLAEDYTAFDLDVITHINAAFSILDQLGVGPEGGFMIEDDTAVWSDFIAPRNQLNLVKTYVYLKVRSLFDPPTTSFLIQATNDHIKEYEWRLNSFREWELDPVDPMVEDEEVINDANRRRFSRTLRQERNALGSSQRKTINSN
jgi:hypothetical protein